MYYLNLHHLLKVIFIQAVKMETYSYSQNHFHILKQKYKGSDFLYYIQETDKPSLILKLFNIILLEEDKIKLPINEEKITRKQAEKLAKKTKTILEKSNCKKIILSKKIQKQEDYVNELYSYNFEIADGKWLFEVLIYKILSYATKKNNLKKEETIVSILVNDMTENTFQNIKKIAKNYKRVNIVTNHMEKFKRMESGLLEKEGIMITVGNNKKKSLSKSQIIINIDFPTELINQYNIYEEAIIINIPGNIKIKKKRFNGTIINDYEIEFNNTEEFDYEKMQKYKAKEIYEAQIYQKQPFDNIMKKINKDQVKIKELLR